MSLKINYNFIDRMLHSVAFSIPFIQRELGSLETDFYKNKFSSIKLKNEVFVTGLPRSGTTLILQILFNTGEFDTFTYRQMPLIMAPIIWSKLSKYFYKDNLPQERAHGDGMDVSFDSPEAFEEIIWLSLFENKMVKDKYIETLSMEDITSDHIAVLRNTIRKLLFINAESDKQLSHRYLSKNNANISRINLLTEVFPSSQIIVPFRNPSVHVSSIMRMHDKFLYEHQNDSFSQKYMKWLGHFEFGANFKPFKFNNSLDYNRPIDQLDANYFMQYWLNAYNYILSSNRESVILVDFDQLLLTPEESLSRLAEKLKLRNVDSLTNAKKVLRKPTTENISLNKQCDKMVWDQSQEIYQQLKKYSI